MDNCYEYRVTHEVTHFHDVIYGGNGKPIAITLTEPDKSEIRFFKKTDKPKTTEIPID